LKIPSKFTDMTTEKLLGVNGGNYGAEEWSYATYKSIVSIRGIKSLSDEQLSAFFNEIMSKLNASKDDAEKYQEAEDFYCVASTEILTRYKVLNVS
jgi:hypothetical protein